MKQYQKINTLYRRYKNLGDKCPNNKWRKFQNKIIMGCYSDPVFGYLYNCQWEGTSKIDGTNSKIAFFPSTGEIKVGGKTDNANSQHGQFEMLQEIGERIKPLLCEMFPKESARFAPVKGDNNKVKYWEVNPDSKFESFNPIQPMKEGQYEVALEEVPIYIYGEYFGEGIQKCGRRYINKGNDFYVFDIDRQGWTLPKDIRDEYCTKLGLKQVPFVGVSTLSDFENMVTQGFVTKVENANDPSLIEEGIVARPCIPINDARGDRIIVKIKHCDYAEYEAVRKEFTDEEFDEFNKWYNDNIEKIF